MTLAAIVLCAPAGAEHDRADVDGVAAALSVDSLVVVVADRDGGAAAVAWAERAFPAAGGVSVVASAPTRYASLARALAALPAEVDVVLVQSGDRRSADRSAVPAVVAAVRAGAPAVVPVVPLADTVKQVSDSGELLSTVDRSVLRVAQTPQGFAREALAKAVADTDPVAGDDEIDLDEIALFVRLGVPVRAVSGGPDRTVERSAS